MTDCYDRKYFKVYEYKLWMSKDMKTEVICEGPRKWIMGLKK